MCKRDKTIRRMSPAVVLIPFALSTLAFNAAAQATQGGATSPESEVATVGVSEAQPIPKEPTKGEKVADLNTVVVTATRRREPVREVPMQIDTVSAATLQNAGASTLRDYVETLPGVAVNSKGSAAQGEIVIRGVTTGSQISNSVGVYLDDAAVSTTGATSASARFPLGLGLLDLHHIEVLRGPQGTLYGAGSMGGVLRYVTNVPNTSEFSATARGDLSATGRNGGTNSSVGGVINIPLSSEAAGLRLAAFDERPAGYIRAIGPAAKTRSDGGRTSGARMAMALYPSESLTLNLTANTQSLHRDGIDLVDYDWTTRKPLYGDFIQKIYVDQPTEKRDSFFSLNVEYKLGTARVNSITTKSISHLSRALDGTVSTVPYIPFPAVSAADAQRVDSKKFTQEFRFLSPKGDKFDWLGGLFYTNETALNVQDGLCALATGSCPSLYHVELPSTYREIAAYGNATYHISPAFSLTAGVRVARNKQHVTQTNSGYFFEDADSAPISSNSTDTSRTYLLTGQYRLSKTSNVYARIATAYRPGGPNVTIPGGALPAQFLPDTSVNYEVGYKTDMLNNTLSIQADAFLINWKNLQQSYSIGGFGGVINAGAARIKGSELTVNYRPTSEFTLGGSFSFVDARLTEDAIGLKAKAGTRLPTSARLSAALSAKYKFDLYGHPARVAATQRFIGDRDARFERANPAQNVKLPGYGVTNLEAGLDFDKYQISFYARNVFNRMGKVSALIVPDEPLKITIEQPRTIGVNLTAEFR